MATPSARPRVVVSGIGVVCSVASSVDELGVALREGRDGIGPIRGLDSAGLRSLHGGEVRQPLESLGVPREAGDPKPVDRASVFALAAAGEALARSAPDLADDERLRTGLAVGTCGGGYLSGYGYLEERESGGRAQANHLLDLPLHAGASRIARAHGLHGGIQAISNACASSAVAIAYGVDRIRSGRSVAMVVGGYETLTLLNCAGFGVMRNSSPSNRIRPFDRDRDGLLLGEGAAFLVLESLERCRRRGGPMLAEILGVATTSDTYHLTAPDPSGRGAARAMSLALEDGRTDREAVDYVNAHGTGTLHNDRMESQAALRLFGDRPPPMSSTKSMVGHTLGSSGAIEAVATVLAIDGGFLPPTLHFETPDPKCPVDPVPGEAREATVRRAITNSFGFGGTNCSILLGAPP